MPGSLQDGTILLDMFFLLIVPDLHPDRPSVITRVFRFVLCSPDLDHRALEFRGFGHGGGLVAPLGICRSIGTLYPIALSEVALVS